MVARHFKFFLVAAEEQSFQRAAERLHVAQSALSRRISDMEREIGGVALFQRFARGVRLTAAGQSMLDDVRRIMSEIEEASHKARRIARGETGLLRIGFADSTGWKRVIPEALRQFEAKYPEIEVQLIPMVSELQRAALRAGSIDVGFMFDYLAAQGGRDPEMTAIPLSIHRFMLVVPRTHPLHDKPAINLLDLKDENLIWPSRKHTPSLFDTMTEACRSQGFVPRIKTEVITVEMACNLTLAGLGLAMIITEENAELSPGLMLRNVEDFSLDSSYVMMWRRDNDMPALSNFVALASMLLRANSA